MYLDGFYQTNESYITIPAEQASRFAKEVAGDFNPLHDPDNKRFCVPGDLLFALTLAKQGVSQKMTFQYTGMVGNGVALNLSTEASETYTLTDAQDKAYLNIAREGDLTTDLSLIEAFTRSYVAFSGHSFPHILVPLMQETQMMINPARPMVIYESMAFELDRLDLVEPSLELASSKMEVDGKRGNVTLEFQVLSQGEICGQGRKTMVLSGLRPYEEAAVQGLIALYESNKQGYQAA